MQKVIFTTAETRTLGEPTHIITSGFLGVPGTTMMEEKGIPEQRYDRLCRALMREPGGHKDMVRTLILPTEHTASAFGVVFMDTGRWVNTCGHASIGCAIYAVEAGLVPVCEPHTGVVIDTPSGTICASARVEDKKAQEVTLHNVPSFLFVDEVKIRIDGKGYRVTISFGGALFALFDAVQPSLQLDARGIELLVPFTKKLLAQLNKQYEIKHPPFAITRVVDAEYYVVTGEKRQKSIVIAEEGQIDRSPCGTGASAKLAYLHTKGNLSANEISVNESFTGTKSYERHEAEDAIGHYRGVQPMTTSSTYVTGKAVYTIDENNPLTYGLTI